MAGDKTMAILEAEREYESKLLGERCHDRISILGGELKVQNQKRYKVGQFVRFSTEKMDCAVFLCQW